MKKKTIVFGIVTLLLIASSIVITLTSYEEAKSVMEDLNAEAENELDIIPDIIITSDKEGNVNNLLEDDCCYIHFEYSYELDGEIIDNWDMVHVEKHTTKEEDDKTIRDYVNSLIPTSLPQPRVTYIQEERKGDIIQIIQELEK